MFNLKNFVMRTLETMKNKLDEYQVRSYALSWYGKGVLTDEDMIIIDSWYSAETEETTAETAEQTADVEVPNE